MLDHGVIDGAVLPHRNAAQNLIKYRAAHSAEEFLVILRLRHPDGIKTVALDEISRHGEHIFAGASGGHQTQEFEYFPDLRMIDHEGAHVLARVNAVFRKRGQLVLHQLVERRFKLSPVDIGFVDVAQRVSVVGVVFEIYRHLCNRLAAQQVADILRGQPLAEHRPALGEKHIGGL